MSSLKPEQRNKTQINGCRSYSNKIPSSILLINENEFDKKYSYSNSNGFIERISQAMDLMILDDQVIENEEETLSNINTVCDSPIIGCVNNKALLETFPNSFLNKKRKKLYYVSIIICVIVSSFECIGNILFFNIINDIR